MNKDKSGNQIDTKMWQCPKCKRLFKRKNQNHYCTKQPESINEYILEQNENIQPQLFHIYDLLSSTLPQAQQRMSWGMPTFWETNNIIHFVAGKNYISIYPGIEAIEHFALELTNYETKKGTIYIPYNEIDDQLIQDITKWCWDTRNN